MKAMILAAGRGERLRPLTDYCPKPLVEAGGQSLIEYHLERLAAAGIKEIIINISWLGDIIQNYLGNGKQFGVKIRYSNEGEHALETAGGIANALSLLGNEPFIVINSDIWTDFDFASLVNKVKVDANTTMAHLVMVNNPEHNPNGDFSIDDDRLTLLGSSPLTFSGIGVYHPALFKNLSANKAALGPLLKTWAEQNKISAEKYSGHWYDIGTPARLNALELLLTNH
ncbi:N-acetylmuramate alpha-1-phosphate uridylyltransferase MurU [Flocculibacter collagenilyticus]|uniref:N-acetylmuramate alpha-1-phosphate uridylyltransferase MurU n=1 Tax=Flocculibacter collagenilyticus TaxID=2744479 RepID=UPI0018F6F04E|nr:nucleotidyltransferase family protein [Flocculibacter collagenilyticus]